MNFGSAATAASITQAQTRDAPGGIHTDLAHMGHDVDLTMKIMKKRQEEMARRTKLLDPRTRQFGVPHQVLDQQIAEKRAAKEKEAEEDRNYALHMAAQEHVLQTIHEIKANQQRQRQMDTIALSLEKHHKETRREYHLSDPKEYTSAYVTLPEEQLGPCSMSRFQGQAVDVAKKKQMQQETAQALRQQMEEKKQRQQAERDLDLFHHDKVTEANSLRTHCELAALQEARQEKASEVEENMALAAARRMKKQVKGQREADEEAEHVKSTTTSDMLCERHDYLVGSTGRLLKGEYRRLTLEEEQNVYDTNARIILEKKARQKAEREEALFERQKANMCEAVLGAVEQEKSRRAKERQQQFNEQNSTVAAAQRERKAREWVAYKSVDHIEV